MATGLRLTAAIFTVVAAYFFYSGYAIETTIVTPGVEGFDGIANLQLMHVQSLNFATAIGAAIIAAILAVGSAIVAAIDTQRSD